MHDQNIVAYKQAFFDGNCLCIVMEYMDNGDLFQKIEEHNKKGTHFDQQTIWSVFIQMVKGLRAMHKLKILHRDLKCANVFMNKDGKVKLGDMNVSKVAKTGLCETQTGTPYYASPEVWNDQPYGIKSDIWSLGCVLYEMTTLKPPFRAQDMEGLYKRVMKGSYPRIPSRYSNELSSIIKCLLQTDPRLRPSCCNFAVDLESIMSIPSVKERVQTDEQGIQLQSSLLKTIKLPKMSKLASTMLPAATYCVSLQKSLVKEQRKPLNMSFPSIGDIKAERQKNKLKDVVRLQKRAHNQENKQNVKELLHKARQARRSISKDVQPLGIIQPQSPTPQNKDFLPRIHVSPQQRKIQQLKDIYIKRY